MCVSFTDFAINKNPYSLKDEYGVICSITVKHLLSHSVQATFRFTLSHRAVFEQVFLLFHYIRSSFPCQAFYPLLFSYSVFVLTRFKKVPNKTDRFFAARFSFVFFIISVNYNAYTIASYGRSVTSESVLTQSA